MECAGFELIFNFFTFKIQGKIHVINLHEMANDQNKHCQKVQQVQESLVSKQYRSKRTFIVHALQLFCIIKYCSKISEHLGANSESDPLVSLPFFFDNGTFMPHNDLS